MLDTKDIKSKKSNQEVKYNNELRKVNRTP